MAEVVVDAGDLVLRLSRREKVEGVHGDLRVPLSRVTRVEVLEDAHRAADVIGVKVGTRIPRVVEVATVHASDRTLFVAVHRDTPRGVRITLAGADHDEWVVGCSDPEAVASMVGSARAG